MTPLQELLDGLDEAAGPGTAPVWVQAYGVPGEDRVLAVDNDIEHIFGWRPPAPCWAVGVVADGWATRLDGGPAPGARRRRVRARVLVGSDGEVASRIHLAGDDAISQVPTSGRLLDGLRRCLGLPTDPPERASSELISLVWVAEVLAAAVDAGFRPLSWAEVVILHPAVRALVEDGHPVDPDHFDDVVAAACRAWTWSRLRLLAAAGDSWLSGVVSPDVAGWMDDGMFSRWLFYEAAPWSRILRDVRAVLPSGVGRRLTRSLEAAGVACSGPHREAAASPHRRPGAWCQGRDRP